jgi:hypothetical protein
MSSQGRKLTDEQVIRKRKARDNMLARVSKLGDTSWPEAGYVIDSNETDDHPTHDNAYCYEHAKAVAVTETARTGAEMVICNVSGSETDNEEWCAFDASTQEARRTTGSTARSG